MVRSRPQSAPPLPRGGVPRRIDGLRHWRPARRCAGGLGRAPRRRTLPRLLDIATAAGAVLIRTVPAGDSACDSAALHPLRRNDLPCAVAQSATALSGRPASEWLGGRPRRSVARKADRHSNCPNPEPFTTLF
jgi:hypothetical protein